MSEKIISEQVPSENQDAVTTIVDDSHQSPTFAELGVNSTIVDGLADAGIVKTFAIQELTLPLAMGGADVIGQARTGMGKTLGFGVPLLHRLVTSNNLIDLDGTPRALVIVPTRELCIQVTEDLAIASKKLRVPTAAGSDRDFRVLAIYGGRPYEQQTAELAQGVDVVVGTPGRLIDLANQGSLVLGKVQVLVLDEADEMLDRGFLPDIERLMSALPTPRQTLLFSATMPGAIVTLARTFLTKPTHIRAELANASAVHDKTAQFFYRAHALDKAEVVARILQAENRGATMIFTRTKRTAQRVADDLAERGFKVGAVHGDLNQIAREKALKKFRTGTIDVLVATDVAARGIDIDDVTHVINYQSPEDEKTYVHRIGRTGRAGRSGVAVTLIDWDELTRWGLITKALGLVEDEPVETYSNSVHLRTDLGIPENATGRLVAAQPEPARNSSEKPKTDRPARRRTRGAATTSTGSTSDGTTSSGTQKSETKPPRTRTRSRGGIAKPASE